MKARQTIPKQWLIINGEIDERTFARLAELPRGAGVLILCKLRPADRRRFRWIAASRQLALVHETAGTAARVHNLRELTRARLRGARLILISPIYATRSHPDWQPLGRMRVATLARLAGCEAIALGGMDERRFGRVRKLGFIGWAGIGSWLREGPRT